MVRSGIRPTVDFPFKLTFGSPNHPAITLHFLNSVLNCEPRIAHVSILNPFLEKEFTDDKLAVLDIRAEDELGRQINIEMQSSLTTGLEQRLTYYASCLYAEQLTDGEPYSQLSSAMSICVLEQALFPGNPKLHLDFRLRDLDGQLLTDDVQVHLVELPKCNTAVHNMAEASSLERWCFFLLNADRFDSNELRRLLPEVEFHEALEVLEMISRTPEQRRYYDARLKFQRDTAFFLEQAKVAGRTEGRTEGLAEGRTEGLAEGRAEGRQIGMIAGQLRMLERILGIAESPDEQLAQMSKEQLTLRLAELKAKLPT